MFIKKLTQQVVCDHDQAVVSTKQGKLRGLISEGTYIFRGIAYARARRFHAPEPVEPWDGVKEALVYGYVCPEIKTPVPLDQFVVPHFFYPQNENCQFLNVWTQSLDAEAGRPVMVWLHGGGFATGSGVEHFAYDGENLSRRGDVVVVTLNHRLNVLGFLDLSAYGAEYANSGNAGMADIVAALAWIHDNIRAFGGDPDNVTVFGQSGGGGKVAALLQMPEADGLFHKGIIQSGVMRRFPETDTKTAGETAERLLARLGLTAKTLNELEEMPYYRLAEAVAGLGDGAAMRFGPVADGSYYAGSIFETDIREHARTIPLIVGNVFGEFRHSFDHLLGDRRKNQWDERKKEELIGKCLGEAGDRAIGAFRRAYPEKNIADLLFMDPMFRRGALEYAGIRAAKGCAPTYNYSFNLESPINGGTVAWHNSEIPYVFRNADYLEASYIPGVTEKLQDMMCDAWTSFASDGKPVAAGMPEWEPYTEENPATMLFDRECRVLCGEDKEILQILSGAGK